MKTRFICPDDMRIIDAMAMLAAQGLRLMGGRGGLWVVPA